MTLGNNKMKKMISAPAKFGISSALTIGIMTVPHVAWASSNTTITNLSTMQVSPTATELRFSFSSNPVTPRVYELKNPASLVLEFDSKSALPSSPQNVGAGLVDSTRTVSTDKLTRVTVLLNGKGSTAPARIEGNQLVMTINSSMQAPAMAGATPVSANTNGSKFGNSVANIKNKARHTIQSAFNALSYNPNYHRNAEPQKMTVRVNPLLKPNLHSSYMNGQTTYDGLSAVNFSGNGKGGTIAIDLTNETVPVDVQRQGNKIVVRMMGSTVPKRLIRRMNIDSKLVSSIDASNKGKNGTVTINMDSDFEYQAYQSGRQLNISVVPPKQLKEPTLEEKVYSGEPLSMEFQDVEIRNVLDILGRFTKMNIVASDDVSGNITLRLINVPWDQALDIILKSKNLDKRVNGNVILVEPAEKFVKAETEALEFLEKKKKLTPLRTEYIRLSYAKVADVEELIEESNTSSNKRQKGSNSGSLLSERGTVSVDKRTNTLIVQDTAERIEDVRALVAKIDIPVKQVMIEARIVSATDNFSKEMGVKWGVLSNGAATNDHMLVGGSNQTLWDLKDFSVESTTVGNQTVAYPKYDITRPDNLNVNLGVGNPAGRVAFSLLNMSEMMLDLELSAMQADNKGEVISTPKVLTADKQKAKISSGTQIPFLSTSSEGTKTEFIEAALSLEVTPNITPDGKIGLNLDISNGSPVVFNGSTVIAEDAIKTNVLVEDGQTVVLGGVFKNTVTNGVTKVPFFGDLPYVGRLFRKNQKDNKKNELLIFITTKVVNDGVSNL